jgi:hypothetical protein
MKILFFILPFFYCLPIVANPVITPNQFRKGSDSDRIEAAISEAMKTGVNSIEIPRYNQQGQKAEWLIDRAIVLPSDFTLVLRDCLVRLSPGTQDNIITNSGARTQPLSENKNIRILGVGNVILSGGLEAHFNPPGDKSGYKTIGILLYNTKHFTIDAVQMEETQAWAISVEHGCAYGRISNIHFNNTNKYPNQDGVNIRKGCHDVIIENITGVTGDDVIALTGLRNYNVGESMQVGGYAPTENDDIYNIIINNVQAKCAGGHHIIRLLNHDGIKMYNVFISNVMDTSLEGEFPRTVRAAVKIGEEARYASVSQNELGDTYRIFITNVISQARNVVWIHRSLKDSVIRCIAGYGGDHSEPTVKVNGEIENVVIDSHKF